MCCIGNGDEGDGRSIKGTTSLCCSWLGLLGTSFIFALLTFFMIVFATWFVEEVCDFGFCHFSFVLCCL
jgi:hypothetical protein